MLLDGDRLHFMVSRRRRRTRWATAANHDAPGVDTAIPRWTDNTSDINLADELSEVHAALFQRCRSLCLHFTAGYRLY